MKILTLMLLTISFSYTNSANIVGLFPFPVKSKHLLGSSLLRELARRGHNVTMVSAFPMSNAPKNYTDVHVKGIYTNFSIMSDFTSLSVFEQLSVYVYGIMNISAQIVSNKNLHEYLATNPKVDVVIKYSGRDPAMLAVAHKLNAPVIELTTNSINEQISYYSGNPFHPAYTPNIFLPYTDEMNFFERLVNTMMNLVLIFITHYIYFPQQDQLVKEFFPDSPPLEELIRNVDLILVNTHFITETPRPYLPHLIQIGGFHIQQPELLHGDLKEFMDQSKHGVIYLSFGTVANITLVKNIKEVFTTLANTTMNVLVRSERSYDVPANVKFMNWIPQTAVLAHPNTKLFITHAGLGGIVEAIYHAVPMICIPFNTDQIHNAKMMTKKGIAVKIAQRDLNNFFLSKALTEILNNKFYEENVKQLSEIYRNQDMNPMDRAMYWIDHVIKYKGAKHMKGQAANLSWYQYLLLDLVVVSFSTLIIGILVVFFIIKLLVMFIKKNIVGKSKRD